MTPEEKWTQLTTWVNSNTCFSGKDVLEVIRAIEDSSTCTCSNCDGTKVCKTCKYLKPGIMSSYCSNAESGWEIHGTNTISCHLWQEKLEILPYPKSTTFLLAVKALIEGDVDVIATNWSRMTILRNNNRILIDHQFSTIMDEFELEGWHLIPKEKL